MIAPLSDAMLTEIDRTQGGPVQVEDPRTRARYVVISEDAYLQALPMLQSSLRSPMPKTTDWSESKNARRVELIKLKHASGITADEETELSGLQNEMYRYRAQVAPLPLEMLELLQAGLERRAEERSRNAGS